MFISIPYSTTLRINTTPYMTYAIGVICLLVLLLQQNSDFSFTQSLMYYPDTLNPVRMITSSISHGDWMHFIGNIIIFIAFAPVVETIISNKWHYFIIILALSFITGLSYSLSIYMSGGKPIPTLGLSGVVMGIIGLSAYLYPHARIRVFIWFITLLKTVYLPAWLLALWYIGWDIWDVFNQADNIGINFVAHISGGISGYFIGVFFLKERFNETRYELNQEMEYLRAQHSPGLFASNYKGKKPITKYKISQQQKKETYDVFTAVLLRFLRKKRHSEAILFILEDYDIKSSNESMYEEAFHAVKELRPTRALFCIGRLLIDLLVSRKNILKH